MSIHYTDTDVLEGGTLVLTINFYDDADTAVTPNEVSYTMRKVDTGEVVNSIEDTAVDAGDLDTSIDLVFSGDDLPAGKLRLYVSGTYDSTSGNDLPFRDIIEFPVREFK
jgi:hypothetical protein